MTDLKVASEAAEEIEAKLLEFTLGISKDFEDKFPELELSLSISKNFSFSGRKNYHSHAYVSIK